MATTSTALLTASHTSAGRCSEIIGTSVSIRRVMDSVQMVARTDSTVLINGETGTGKELVARAIHEGSLRGSGPYVKLNCAAMPAGLLESELFGHERGAFTGAWAQTTGRFQRAHGGTLFLDEIGDLPLELQPKLLRVLQESEFERLGGSRTVKVDVRVVAATNQDLFQMVRDRRFRADLFYRLNVFPVSVPSLRERREDIPLLVRHFVDVFSRRMNREVSHVPESLVDVLKLRDWPGNIRELRNFIERAMIISSGPVLNLPSMELENLKNAAPSVTLHTLEDANREYIGEVLRRTGWVVGGREGAAALLGLPRTTLLHRMQKLGISRKAAASC